MLVARVTVSARIRSASTDGSIDSGKTGCVRNAGRLRPSLRLFHDHQGGLWDADVLRADFAIAPVPNWASRSARMPSRCCAVA